MAMYPATIPATIRIVSKTRQRTFLDKLPPEKERWSLPENLLSRQFSATRRGPASREPGVASGRRGRRRRLGLACAPGDRVPEDLDLHVVRDLQHDDPVRVVEGGDPPQDPTRRDDLVSPLQLREHLLLPLLFLAHRRNEKEVEDDEDEDHREELDQSPSRSGLRRGLEQVEQ